MTRKKTKSDIITQNDQILHETMPKYLSIVIENDKLLREELRQWESIVPNVKNPKNMERHINKLYAELQEWRNLIPGKHTVKAARHFLKIQEPKEQTIVDDSDMILYNTLFLDDYGIQYRLKPFDDIQTFIAEKKKAIINILNEDIDPLTKTINDRFYFIKFFEMKRDQEIPDADFNVNDIEKYTKW